LRKSLRTGGCGSTLLKLVERHRAGKRRKKSQINSSKPYLHQESYIYTNNSDGYLMTTQHPRIIREKKTIEHMVHLYCKKHHGTHGELCVDCTEFLTYSKLRLDKCPFQENKSTCGKCLVHCYNPEMKAKVRVIMRYSGPRLLLYHPSLALHHLWDGRKKPPQLGKKTA
jgi:hypothetical protein